MYMYMYILSSLDSLPGGAQLDEHSLLADPSLLIQLNEATSLLDGALQIIRQPIFHNSNQ